MKRWLNFSQLAWGSHRDKSRAGYTITEVMIVLAISAGLFVVVALLLQGRQKAAQYSEAIRSFEGQIQTMASDVQKGYYTNTFACTTGQTGSPQIETDPAAPNVPGANEGCVFMGKVMQAVFEGGADSTGAVQVLTMIGRRTITVDGHKHAVETLTDAASIPASDITTSLTLNWGMEVTRMLDIAADAEVKSFAFMTNPSGVGVSQVTPVALYTLVNDNPSDPADFRKATEGVRICLNGPTGQPGMVTVGTSGDQLSTNVEIGNELCQV